MRRRVTLTFDNGPHPDRTDRILDELARRNLRASFFVVGSALQKDGALDLARRAHDEGHWIGNHTMTHGEPLGLRADNADTVEEIARLQSLLGPLAHARRLFRPNGRRKLGPHLLNRTAIDYLCANAYTVIGWNSVLGDTDAPPDSWVDRALADVERQGATLLVLHDVPRSGAAENLPRFLDELERRDVEIVQEFPEECVLVESGRRTEVLERVMSLT
jgi:peptidoglycan/xylan/chitin deacetylase (PgdA/CDA1 family)